MVRSASAMRTSMLVAATCFLMHATPLWAKALPNCTYPAVYSFGDSLTDVGNSIAAFPEQFAASEEDPYGVEFPQHAADRLSDGKLLVDFLGTSCSLLVLVQGRNDF